MRTGILAATLGQEGRLKIEASYTLRIMEQIKEKRRLSDDSIVPGIISGLYTYKLPLFERMNLVVELITTIFGFSSVCR